MTRPGDDEADAVHKRGDQLPGSVAGFRLRALEGSQTQAHTAARAFCLSTIKEFYNFDYRKDWHEDLDSLCLAGAGNHYAPVNRGAFWYLTGSDGEIVATAGVRHLEWKPAILEAFKERYPDPRRIASLWRLYVRKDLRGAGIGRKLNALAEAEAVKLGYDTMYLHASSDAAATISFWKAMGYEDIGEYEFSTHFDKRLDRSAQ